MHVRSRPAGYTLVELLVVIALVIVLIGLLLTSVSEARAASRRVRCLSNLRQLAAANQLYLAEFPGWNTPAFWGWSPAAPPWPPNTAPAVPPSGPRRHWYQVWSFSRALNAVRPGNGRYVGDLLCSDASLAWERGNANGYPLNHSYGMNRTQMPGVAVAGAPDYWNAWRVGQVRCPAEKIHFIDAVSATVNANGSFNATLRYFAPGFGEQHGPPDRINIVAYRHSRGANVLFHDGHGEWRRESELRYSPAVAETTRNKRQWEPTRP